MSIFALSGLFDRVYYGVWTFPIIRFLQYNIIQSLAVFYGKHTWNYYITEGLPLLLTTALPFSITGLGRALTRGGSTVTEPMKTAQFQLAITVIFTTAVLSLVSHKEVRFIYPLLPVLHLFAAESLARFLIPASSPDNQSKAPKVSPATKTTVAMSLFINLIIAYYATAIHQKGVINVLDYLRHEHESRQSAQKSSSTQMSVGFLMPCHSTPWRSHLIHPGIQAWALECEPPVDLSSADRKTYVDEADRFYNDPATFIRNKIVSSRSLQHSEKDPKRQMDELPKIWPDYLVFFDQLEQDVRDTIKREHGGGYEECWRGFNTHWHDDWRRRGDVIVWCVR